jgi:hypothetical protein
LRSASSFSRRPGGFALDLERLFRLATQSKRQQERYDTSRVAHTSPCMYAPPFGIEGRIRPEAATCESNVTATPARLGLTTSFGAAPGRRAIGCRQEASVARTCCAGPRLSSSNPRALIRLAKAHHAEVKRVEASRVAAVPLCGMAHGGSHGKKRQYKRRTPAGAT